MNQAASEKIGKMWGKSYVFTPGGIMVPPESKITEPEQLAGQEIAVGTWAHWQLMEQACRAKFSQNEEARAALLATGWRPLVHVVRRDSKAIPGVIMADIWMRIRAELRSQAG